MKHEAPLPPWSKQSKHRRARLKRVVELLCECVPAPRIAEYVADEFSCQERTVWSDIKYCRREVLPYWYEWGEQRLLAIEAVSKLDRIAKRAIDNNQLSVAVTAIRQACELMGLNSAQRIAGRKETLRGELDVLRNKLAQRDDKRPDEFSLEAFNETRAMYGFSTMTPDEFERYRAEVGRRSNGN